MSDPLRRLQRQMQYTIDPMTTANTTAPSTIANGSHISQLVDEDDEDDDDDDERVAITVVGRRVVVVGIVTVE